MSANIFKNLVLWVAIFVGVFAVYQFMNTPANVYSEISYSKFLEHLDNQRIAKIEFGENIIRGELKNADPADRGFTTTGPAGEMLIAKLEESGVEFSFSHRKQSSLTQILINWGPLFILVALMVFFMRQVQAGGTKAMSFGKNRARMLGRQVCIHS